MSSYLIFLQVTPYSEIENHGEMLNTSIFYKYLLLEVHSKKIS